MRLAMPVYGKNAKRELTTEFRGYNCTDAGGEGSGRSTFSDMLNGGTDKYPFAASRLCRSVTEYDESTSALFGGEVLARVQPPYLIYGDNSYDLGLISGEKQIVRMGTNILIFPDGKFFNTANGEYGDIDEGEEYSDVFHDISKIQTDEFGEICIDDGPIIDVIVTTSKGGTRTTAKMVLEAFVSIDDLPLETPYLGIDEGTARFVAYCPLACKDKRLYRGKEWKHVKINSTLYMTDIVWEELKIKSVVLTHSNTPAWKGLTNLWSNGEYVNIKSESTMTYRIELLPGQIFGDILVPTGIKGSNRLRVSYAWRSRTLPIFDYVTVSNNRLLGCRSGMPYDGSEPVNRIYVSAPNNFKAFEQFAGISTDSWWGDVSEEGPFTAACTYNGYPMFFKEDCMYILYGDYPPYSYNAVKIRGVAEGAYKSLIELNGALFYKSRHDIMRYTSSSLSSISQALGNISGISRAVGGAYRDSYYISLDGETFVFDTTRGMWAKEDAISVIDFAHVDGALHFLSDCGKVYKVNDGDERMPWSLTSPPIGYEYPNRKRLYSLQIRIELGKEDELPTVELSLDGGEFKECRVRVNFTDGEGRRTGSILIPVSTCRCELLRYRVSGYGTYKLTGVTKVIKEGGK